MRKVAYTKTSREQIPANVRFDVPPHNQGQIVEVAYAEAKPSRSIACHGDEYQRVTDRSDGSVAYYVRSDLAR